MERADKNVMREYFHCSDCDLTVHKNDRDNHISGGRHKYRMRRKTPETNNAEPQMQCVVCNTQFTDMHFYTIHQGSKTHKRNLKRAQKSGLKKGIDDKLREDRTNGTAKLVRPKARRVPIEGIETYVSIADFKDVSDYKSVREKYRPRNTKNPEANNKAYASSVIAYWSVSLALEPTVRDFKISVNDKEWGDFGDAVVQIELKESKKQPTFAVQFKDVSNNSKSIYSLDEGKFGFAKYMAQVSAIKHHEEGENKKYVVFTTALAEPQMVRQMNLKNELLHKTKQNCDCKGKDTDVQIVATPPSNRRKLLIDTSDDNDHIFFFFCTDKIHILPNIYLYTHQKKQKHFGAWIDNLLSNELFGERRIDIHREFIKYIEYWTDGYLGGNYRLKKEDVLVKLGHLLLYSFKIPPIVRSTEKQDYGIWQLTVNSVDVTILKNHPVILSKICEPLNVKIETELEVKIDTSTSSIYLSQNVINTIDNPVLKMYLFEETMGDIQDDIPLDLVYDFFWKAGLLPLLLHVEDLKDQEHILNIVSLLKSLGLTRRYFLITPDQNLKTSLRYYKTLDFFVNVGDIASKIPSFLLDKVKIGVTDKFALSIRAIQESDMFFQRTVSAHEFFDMSLGRYNFKSFSNNLAKRDGAETQLVLDDDTMRQLKEQIDSKDEMKMVFSYDCTDGEKQLLLGDIKPDLFSL